MSYGVFQGLARIHVQKWGGGVLTKVVWFKWLGLIASFFLFLG